MNTIKLVIAKLDNYKEINTKMLSPKFIFIFVTVMFSSNSLAQVIEEDSTNIMPFVIANIRFEQNVTDGDVEVVIEIKAEDEGLINLSVFAPDGNIVFHFTAPENSTLGIRQFHLETPEPKDIESVKKAYPEGIYKFTGVGISGIKYYGEDILNHILPDTVAILNPATEVLNAEISELEISWTAVANITAYILEIDQDELGVKISAELPSTVTKFVVPKGVVQTGFEYALSIGTIMKNDNRSFVETTFSISAGK